MRVWFGTKRDGDFGEGIAICTGEERTEEVSLIDANSSRPVSMEAGRGLTVDEDESEHIDGWFARWYGRSGSAELLRLTVDNEFWSSARFTTGGLGLKSDIGLRLRAAALSAAEKIMPAS